MALVEQLRYGRLTYMALVFAVMHLNETFLLLFLFVHGMVDDTSMFH